VIDKTGADAAEFREFTEGGRILREPVMSEAHKAAMIHDLYRAGWFYRLIAQLCRDDNETVRDILARPIDVRRRVLRGLRPPRRRAMRDPRPTMSEAEARELAARVIRRAGAVIFRDWGDRPLTISELASVIKEADSGRG